MIFARLAERLDRMEGLKGNPRFYKTVFEMIGGNMTDGQVLRAMSSEQAEMSGLDVSDVSGAVPDSDSGTAQINVEMSLISLIDAENDQVVHQFPTQWLEYNCEVFMFTTHETFESDGAYATETTIEGARLVQIRDFTDTVIHEAPLSWFGLQSETFGME
jgi:hypothetical protein